MNIVKQNQMKLNITKLSSHNVSNNKYFIIFRKIYHQLAKKFFIVLL